MKKPRFLAVFAALLGLAGLAGPAAAGNSDEEAAARAQVNLRRTQVGLAPLNYNSLIETAARNHANYLVLNGIASHAENSTLSGFTGNGPGERLTFVGYGWRNVDELTAYNPATGVDSIEGLMRSIYHRFKILATNMGDQGAAFTTNHPSYPTGVLVSVLAASQSLSAPVAPANWIGTYPYDGQIDVPIDYFSDTTSPDPVPATNRVGYPVSIHVDSQSALSEQSFTLTPVGGSPVAIAATLTAATDPNAETPPSVAAVIPQAVLQYGTTYQANFVGTVTKPGGTTSINKTWTFTTVPSLPITFSPAPATVAVGGSLVVALNGGSGTLQNWLISSGGESLIAIPPDRITSNSLTIKGLAVGSATVTVWDADIPPSSAQFTVNVQNSVNQVPSTFSFAPVTGAAISTTVTSASITVLGTNAPTLVRVSGGAYSVNGGAFTSQIGTANSGDSIRVRLTSASAPGTTDSVILTIGGVSATFSVTTTFAANLVPGWNLLGNGMSNPITVSNVFNDASKVATVWKWLSGTSPGWAFYTPQQTDGGASYAASKGYSFLTTINGGEGFWVNAKASFSVPSSGTPITTGSFADNGAGRLPTSWSLVSVGDNPMPRAFANGISATGPASGAVAATSVTTLWAWYADPSGTSSGWFFYSPSLDNSGSLGSYITSKGYLNFGTAGKTLDPVTGFWVNHP